MSYLGRVENKSSDIRQLEVSSSTSATHTLTWTAPNVESLIVTINGVTQQGNYTVSGVTLTLDTPLTVTDVMQVLGINDIGTTITPAQGSVNTAQLANDAVTADKLANSINTEIAANTAKVTNATHTGDVTGSTALTIAVDAVDIPMLSASGTADATTYLRGDNSWAVPGGGKVLQVVTATYDTATTMSSTSYASTGLSCSITPASASNKVLILYSGMCRVWANSAASGRWVTTAIYRVTDTTVLTEQTTKEVNVSSSTDLGWAWSQCFSTLDSPSTASAVEYRIDGKVNNASVHRSTYQNEGSDSTLTLLEIEG